LTVVGERLPEAGFAAKLTNTRKNAAETRASPRKIRGIKKPFWDNGLVRMGLDLLCGLEIDGLKSVGN